MVERMRGLANGQAQEGNRDQQIGADLVGHFEGDTRDARDRLRADQHHHPRQSDVAEKLASSFDPALDLLGTGLGRVPIDPCDLRVGHC